jgi:imidazole glycerol-phosphate synthase subunit HisH
MKIVVPDLGLSNLWSALRALEALGHEGIATARAVEVAAAETILLPGVGAFAEASRRLERTGLGNAIRSAAAGGARVIGICLGMQLLFETSEEGGDHPGLGLLPGRVARLAGGALLPHVGWNSVRATERGRALFGESDGGDFYFVHSFVARPTSENLVLARCLHGESFAAAVGDTTCIGFQFHPEKSGSAGVRLLGSALEMLAKEEAGGDKPRPYEPGARSTDPPFVGAALAAARRKRP